MNYSQTDAERLHHLKKINTTNGVNLVLAHLCCELKETSIDIYEEPKNNTAIFKDITSSERSKEHSPTRIQFQSNVNHVDKIYTKLEKLSMDVPDFKPTGASFSRARIDSDAQGTVIGKSQGKAHCRRTRQQQTKFIKTGQKWIFSLESSEYHGLRPLRIHIPDEKHFGSL